MRVARGKNGDRQRRALKRNGVIAKPNGQRLARSLERVACFSWHGLHLRLGFLCDKAKEHWHNGVLTAVEYPAVDKGQSESETLGQL